MNITILRHETLDSTNSEAINQAKRGADEGVCIVAAKQTAGRGRHGRTWSSAKNSGLYFSIVLRPKIELRLLPLLTFVGALAVHETLRELYGLSPDIKWANDVLIDSKKISGVLAEAVETNVGLAVILGIGINLKSKTFAVELTEIATSIESETKKPADSEELLRSLIHHISCFYDLIESENGGELIRTEWINRSSYASGKRVKAILGESIIYGTTDGIEENGALRVKTDGGKLEIIQAGDVERLRTDS